MGVLRLMNDGWVHEWIEGERDGREGWMEGWETIRCLHRKMESN